MDDRQDMIHDAYKQTFEWIFCDPLETGKPWAKFTDFLQSASAETYWISGKPGSGQSTLMKYISSHTTAKKLLFEWAGSGDLVMATYPFNYGALSFRTPGPQFFGPYSTASLTSDATSIE
jgi:hypothetical protein